MSVERFQNVVDWLVSTDVGSVSTFGWEEEETGFVAGLDDDIACGFHLTSAYSADDPRCYNITQSLNSPLQGK